MPLRRIDDFIRSLCQKLIEADEESEEYQKIAAELRTALTEQSKRSRKRLMTFPLPKERRTSEP